MIADLSSLPPELLHQTLTYLPVSSLLAFGQTSKYHHAVSARAFLKLRLGAFPSQINCVLSLFDALGDDDMAHSVQILLERKKNRSKDLVVRNQNRKLSAVLERQGRYLHDLEVSLWALEDPLAKRIGSLGMLRRLSVRMDHPHTRHADVPLSFWKSAEPSAAWNRLYANPGNGPLVPLGRLQILTLERAGITSYQLRRVLECNPRVTELRLRKCLALDDEFWAWLAASRFATQLKVFHFTHNTGRDMDNRVLDHLDAFSALEVSSSGRKGGGTF